MRCQLLLRLLVRDIVSCELDLPTVLKSSYRLRKDERQMA
jgi:hypothetical protein